MQPLNLFCSQLTQARLFSVFSLASMMFALAAFCQIGFAQQQAQLSLADILIGLRSKKVTIEERNKLLSDAIKVRGITFALTPEIETELATTGASGELLEAVRLKALKVPAKSEAAIIPVSMPAEKTSQPDAAFYRNRANENNLRGEYDLALADYAKAIELNPKDAASYFNRGRVYAGQKSFDLAILDFDKTIELTPKDASAFVNRAAVHDKKGNQAQAIADYQKAVELDANHASAKMNLKRLLDEQAKAEAKQKEEEQARLLAEQKKNAPAPAPIVTEQPKVVAAAAENPNVPKAVGSLVGQAIRMVTPVYPQSAKQMNINGQVKVEITLDEKGSVVAVKAVSGPQFLRATSEEAARNSKFKPALAGSEPVKATGFVVYNFTNKM